MEYFLEKLRGLGAHFRKTVKSEELVEVSRREAYLAYAYKLLSWEDPSLTWTALIGLHFVFWLVVQFQVRLYGFIFLTLLIAFVCDTYFERTGLKAQRSEVSDTFRHAYELFLHACCYLRTLRKDSPSTFCGTMCVAFLVVSFIARNLSGYLFAYLVLLGVFFGPLLVSKLPEEYVDYVRHTLQNLTNEGLVAEQELIPFIAEKDFGKRDPDLDSLLTDRTIDSLTSSLISGITSMPSYMEVDGLNVPDLEEEDLKPRLSRASYTPIEYSSDSDSEFKNLKPSSHLNVDSSSEDDGSFSKGLKFTEGAVQTQVLNALGEIGKIFARSSPPKRNDSSDSDFEIINSEEVDERS